MTLRDAAKSKLARLDFVRKSWDIDRLTRPIDLHRKWSYVTGLRLQKGHLARKQDEPKRIDNHWLFDGEIARHAIVTRQQAERDGRGILDEFVLLCGGSDEAILKSPGRGACWNSVATIFRPAMSFLLVLLFVFQALCRGGRGACGGGIRMIRVSPPTGLEPLATWRFFSAQARALLKIAGDLQRAQLGDKEGWAKLLRQGVVPAQSLDAQRLCVRDAIEGWLKLGRIKPTIDDLTIGLTWTGADLFGELAVQIALAAKAMDGQVLCVACGKAYQPKRRVIRRGFNYCSKEKCQREEAAQRAERYRVASDR